MAEHSPKHGLTRTKRGWVRRINGIPKWICGHPVAPTAAAADDYYERNFATLWQPAAEAASDDPEDAPIVDLFNVFLTRKKAQIGRAKRGISQQAFDEYKAALDDFCAHRPDKAARTLGQTPYRDLQPSDFGSFDASISDRFGVDRQKKWIITVRSAFKLLAMPPIRLPLPDYGDQFQLPTKRDMRVAKARHKQKHGPKLYEPAEAKALLIGRWRSDAELGAEAERRAKPGPHRGLPRRVRRRIRGAGRALRAMILLALNAGFGNTDLGELSLPTIRRALKSGWIDYERGKTGARRLAWLWPETIHAVERYLRHRPEPIDAAHADLVFLTEFGYPFITDTKDQIAIACGRLICRLGLVRLGRNFYSLRRTYRTIAADVGKEIAIDLSMGHADDGDDMAKVYTLGELRAELKKISMHVRSVVLCAPMLMPEESARRPAAMLPASKPAVAVPAAPEMKPSRRKETARHSAR